MTRLEWRVDHGIHPRVEIGSGRIGHLHRSGDRPRGTVRKALKHTLAQPLSRADDASGKIEDLYKHFGITAEDTAKAVEARLKAS